ncbi:MAG: MoaD/ThiS family protein [Proteobacteria bacterium]|nr:MoaD/ThiS family protein [Pseudomonadota bacterium]
MRFFLSGNLLRFSNYHREIDVEAATIYEGIFGLINQYPDLRPVLLDGDDEVRGVHRLFLDGQPLAAEGLREAVPSEADVTILTAIAGG